MDAFFNAMKKKYQKGGENKNILKNSPQGDITTKKAVNKYVNDKKVIDKTFDNMQKIKKSSDVGVKGPKAVKARSSSNLKRIAKAAKKIGKKRGVNMIPIIGQAIAAAQIYKEIKSGGKGIKKNIKNVKDFVKTGDVGHILEGKSSKKTTSKKNCKEDWKKEKRY